MSLWNRLSFLFVCAIGILATLLYGTVHQPTIILFYLLVSVGFISFGIGIARSENAKVSLSRVQLPLLLLGTYALIQTVPFGSVESEVGSIARTISLDPYATWQSAIHIAFLSAFLFVGLSTVDSNERIQRLAFVITIFGGCYAFYAILQSILSPDKIYGIYKPAAGSPFGSFVNKHDFAAVIEMSMSIPLGMIFSGVVRSDKRLLYGVAVVIMGAALLLSGSRGGLVAMIAGFILLVMLTSRIKGPKKILLNTGLAVALLIAAVGGAIFVGGDTSLTRFADQVSAEDISSSRFQIWAVSGKVVMHHFPLGAGVGAFPLAYERFDPSGGFERVEQAHNDYLQLLADAGIIGAVIGIGFLFLFFRAGQRALSSRNPMRRAIAVGAISGCFAVLVHSLFDFVLQITAVSVLFLTLLTLLVAAGREELDPPESSNEPSKRKHAKIMPIGG